MLLHTLTTQYRRASQPAAWHEHNAPTYNNHDRLLGPRNVMVGFVLFLLADVARALLELAGALPPLACVPTAGAVQV